MELSQHSSGTGSILVQKNLCHPNTSRASHPWQCQASQWANIWPFTRRILPSAYHRACGMASRALGCGSHGGIAALGGSLQWDTSKLDWLIDLDIVYVSIYFLNDISICT